MFEAFSDHMKFITLSQKYSWLLAPGNHRLYVNFKLLLQKLKLYITKDCKSKVGIQSNQFPKKLWMDTYDTKGL